MHLSRLYIKNYRSIKEIDLEFKKGKNVIVGRNNAGKSNIIKALDLVLGENSPTWNKSENITDTDFFNDNTEEPIFIFCELKNDVNFSEEDYKNMYENCFGFKVYVNIEKWENKKPIKKVIELELSEDLLSIDDFFSIEEETITDFEWIDLKKPQNKQLEKLLNGKNTFAFVFKAYKEKGIIKKEVRFLIKSSTEEKWGIAFKDNLRNIFLESAIIPAFRDPNNQLRISNYSWYGKLLKNYVKCDDNNNLKNAFKNLKKEGQAVFSKLETKVGDKKINIAFPNTKISFQFNPEQKEVYKNTQIYVDDGFLSPLQDKGSGIQSAVIIGLFDFYVRNVVHLGSSLLAIEEPELYLHPHGRRVISDRLNDFLDGGKNQVIVATHSTEFIVPIADDLNIIILRKDKDEGTKGKNIDFSGIENIDRKQILIKKEVAEMFFADCVILTEDCKYFIEEVAKIVGEENKELGKHWLNNNNISVINCGGKSWFYKYKKLLDYAGIPNYILADFDYLRDGIEKIIVDNNEKNNLNSLKGKLGIYQNYKKITDITDKSHKTEIIEYLKNLIETYNLFLLNGELEDNYLEGIDFESKNKEQRVIETISKIIEKNKTISDFIDISQIKGFLLFVVSKQGIISDDETGGNIVGEKVETEVENGKISIEDVPF